MNKNESFSRVLIDAQLADQGWNTQDTTSIRHEVVLEDGTRADYVLCDRHGRSLAVIEAKRFSVNPADAAEQARNYARQLNVPYIFLANGQEIRFWEWRREAYPLPVKTFFKQDDLERRAATAQVKRNLLDVPIDKTGLWHGSCEAVAASYFIRMRVKRASLNPFYLWAFMNSAHMKKVLFETARGAIGQANINARELRAFKVPLPPSRIQDGFETRCRDVAGLVSQQSSATARAQATFDALLHTTFSASS